MTRELEITILFPMMIANSNYLFDEKMKTPIIDHILRLKQICRIEEELGKEYGLAPSEIFCLFTINGEESLSSADLSARMNLSPSRGSRIIKGLFEKGYFKIEHMKSDKRRLNISLTKKGNSCLHEMQGEKLNCERRLVKDLSVREIAAISKQLETLVSAF